MLRILAKLLIALSIVEIVEYIIDAIKLANLSCEIAELQRQQQPLDCVGFVLEVIKESEVKHDVQCEKVS